MLLDPKFDWGQIVYLKTDCDQLPRIVTAMKIRENAPIEYGLSCVDRETFHYELEISESKNLLLITTG